MTESTEGTDIHPRHAAPEDPATPEQDVDDPEQDVDPEHAAESPDEPPEDAEEGAAVVEDPIIRATALSLRTRQGTVFTDVSLTVQPASLAVICGLSGSGRSALLLSLCGRMRGLSGELVIDGLDGIRQARRVRVISAPARVSGLVDLEGRLTVADSVTERSLIDGLHPRTGRQEFTTVAEQLDLTLDHDQLIDTLPAHQRTLLAVALACLRRPRLLLLDDLDRGLNLADQTTLLDTLADLAATGITVVATTTDRTPVPTDALVCTLQTGPRTVQSHTDPEES